MFISPCQRSQQQQWIQNPIPGKTRFVATHPTSYLSAPMLFVISNSKTYQDAEIHTGWCIPAERYDGSDLAE